MIVGNFFTVLLGCQKELSQISCRLLIVNVSIGLEIVLKTTEIHIGRSDRTYFVVGNEYFSVQKTAFIEEYPYARNQYILKKTLVDPAKEQRIRASGQHDTYIDAYKGRRLQRLQKRLRRNKVRRLYINVVACVLYEPRQRVGYL